MPNPDYTPLRHHLKQQPAALQVLPMTFEEIEVVLGFPLPPTALNDHVWWATLKKSGRWLATGWKPVHVWLKQRKVEFGRVTSEEPGSQQTRPSASKQLREYLESLPSDQARLVLTFDDLAAIRGKILSETAQNDRTWWANTESSSHGRAWLAAGWEVDKVYLTAQIVTFHRIGMDVLGDIQNYVKHLLGEAPNPGHPSMVQIKEWLRLCRRVNWLFEATVLYERGGAGMQPISDDDHAEMEEDYTFCQRRLLRYSQSNREHDQQSLR